MTQPEVLRSLLNAIAQGEVSPEVALDKLKHLAFEPVDDFARIDHHRALRTGFPEVIWGPGKTPDQIAQIMEVMRDRASVVMATRIEPDVYAQLKQKVPDVEYFAIARICALGGQESGVRNQEPGAESLEDAGMRGRRDEETASIQNSKFKIQNSSPIPGLISILSAGTADLPVAERSRCDG
ncbi:hypothetical protein [Kovacikia minuta]